MIHTLCAGIDTVKDDTCSGETQFEPEISLPEVCLVSTSLPGINVQCQCQWCQSTVQQRPCSFSSSPSENQLSPSIYTKGCPKKCWVTHLYNLYILSLNLWQVPWVQPQLPAVQAAGQPPAPYSQARLRLPDRLAVLRSLSRLIFPQHFFEKFFHTLPRMVLTPRSWQLSSAISSWG